MHSSSVNTRPPTVQKTLTRPRCCSHAPTAPPSLTMRSTITVGLLALAGFSAAQDQYQIDPETVQQSTRDYWCDQQKASCPQICLQQPGVSSMNTVSNECDPVRNSSCTTPQTPASHLAPRPNPSSSSCTTFQTPANLNTRTPS